MFYEWFSLILNFIEVDLGLFKFIVNKWGVLYIKKLNFLIEYVISNSKVDWFFRKVKVILK